MGKDCIICVIFGSGADKRSEEADLPTNSEGLPSNRRNQKQNGKQRGEFRELDLIYTESKWENRIDRLTSRAEHPRQTERVPRVLNLVSKWYSILWKTRMWRGFSLNAGPFLAGR